MLIKNDNKEQHCR